MSNKILEKAKKTRILSKIATITKRDRLGNLMVISGHLTTEQLRNALSKQKIENAKLGHILVKHHFVSRNTLYKTLAKQSAMRCLIAVITITISCASFNVKGAQAGTFKIKDIPLQVHLASTANKAFSPINNYPSLFGAEERKSYNLEPFTKWTGMFERFDKAINTEEGKNVLNSWKRKLETYKGLPLQKMAQKVNSLINSEPYIVDSKNWNKGDYWETPVEFFSYGGDCEDFAIAKYVSLRALGVPEERLRIAIVHDKQKDVPHAILILYTDEGAVVLDNQAKDVKPSGSINHYKPIFSINRQAWWLHTKPQQTILASAR